MFLAERLRQPRLLAVCYLDRTIWCAVKRSCTKMQMLTPGRSIASALVFVFLLTAALAASTSTFDENVVRRYELTGQRLTARFQVTRGGLKVTGIEDLGNGAILRPGEVFALQLRDGQVIAASQLRIDAGPSSGTTGAQPIRCATGGTGYRTKALRRPKHPG